MELCFRVVLESAVRRSWRGKRWMKGSRDELDVRAEGWGCQRDEMKLL